MKFDSILVAVVVLMGVLLPRESEAVVMYFESVDINIPDTYAGVSVDLESGTSSTSLSGVSGGDANFIFGGAGISNDADAGATVASWQPVRTGTGNTDAIKNLAFDTVIDANTSFYSTGFGASEDSHIGTGTDLFESNVSGYIGFSLIIDAPLNPGNDLTVYGWAQVTFNDAGAGTLHSWAYEDNGGAIQVGAVPEPSTLLFLLAAGFALLRRRK